LFRLRRHRRLNPSTFHDGSPATIMDVINFYDKRFGAGFTDHQKQDLANFLLTL
jgi:hypothetical protein